MNKIRFKFVLFLTLTVILLLNPITQAQTGEVIVDSVSAFPSSDAELPVYISFPIAIDAIEVVLEYDDTHLVFDSVSLVGSIIEGNEAIDTYVTTNENKVSFTFLYGTGTIGPVSGQLYSLFFSTEPISAGKTFVIDTTSWIMQGGAKHRTFYSVGGYSYNIALFEKGYVTVLNAPPTNDSVWVDSVGAMAGNQVALGVYGKNEEDLAKIDLTFSYSSASLTFNDVIFDGSRSLSAQRTEEANQSERNIHIELLFGEDTPLTPGTGLLATILFDVSSSAFDELVIIDSTSYLVPTGQSLEFTQTLAEGGINFAPYYKKGYVDIKSTTDIQADDNPIIPADFSLAQNHPNPFNPGTSIKFALPKAGQTRLTVYNVLGQMVRRLVDEKLTAGTYTVYFDGRDENKSEIASGIYFYRLETEGFTQSKKMMLLK